MTVVPSENPKENDVEEGNAGSSGDNLIIPDPPFVIEEIHKPIYTKIWYHKAHVMSIQKGGLYNQVAQNFFRLFVPLEQVFIAALVEAGVERVEILGVEVILSNSQGVAESLIMHYLALTQELNGLFNVGVVNESQDVVVGRASRLLCYYLVFATKLSLAKVRKTFIFQGVSALLTLPIFQKFQ